MTERFTTNKYYIYDRFKDGEKWLVNEVEANDIVKIMNNLDCKARERSKALSKLQKENEQLKKALLFFVDVANGEYSSDWQKDMEKCCQKLLNCSYKEAKEKYGNYNGDWWELE